MRTVDEVQRSMTEDLKLRGACSLLDVLDALPGADRAAQLREFEKLPDEALRRLVRSDRRRLVVTVRVPDSGAVTLKPIFEQLDLRLERIAAEHPGFRLWLTGTVVVSARNMTHIIADLRRSLIGAAVVIFVMMGIGLRSTTAALVSVVPNVFPLSVMAGLLLLTGEPLRITTALTFNVALGLAVNDTIHVLVRFRSERAAAVDYPTAIVRAYEAVGAPMLMSTWVLMAGFASNMLSDMPAIQQFGAWASAAMLAALLGDAVILPAMLRLCMPRSRE